jgi:hypothetical protein
MLCSMTTIRKYGATEIRFAIFDTETDGTELWSENRSGDDAVDVENGFFSVYLGDVALLDPAVLLTSAELWLGAVEGETLGRARCL